MGFFEAIGSVFGGYFRFSGRAARSEYWWFFLFEVLVVIGLGIVDFATVSQVIAQAGDPALALAMTSPFDFMLVYYFIATFFPRMTVTVRRLHDVGLSGLFYLVYFVPIVGGLVVFVMTLFPSESRDNTHGPYIGRSTGPRKARVQVRKPVRKTPKAGEMATAADLQAARKAEIRALYEQRVLGKGAIAAE